MTRLTPQGEKAIQELREKHLLFRQGKEAIERELKDELERRVYSLRADRDMALRLAAEAGVPRTKLGQVIGTTNYRTVQEILENTSDSVVSNSDGWSVAVLSPDTIRVNLSALGVRAITGSAVFKVGEELEYLEGDEYVLPTIHREGIYADIVNAAR